MSTDANNAAADDEDNALSSAGEQYLTFILNDEHYGIDILKVQSVQGWERVTEVPNSPDYMLGVINMRGDVVPIIDMRSRFELGSIQFTERTVVIIVKVDCRDHERTVGLVVDAVSEVHNLRTEDYRDTPDLGSNISSEYVKGLGLADTQMVILLDVDRLVASGIMEMLSAEAREAAREG